MQENEREEEKVKRQSSGKLIIILLALLFLIMLVIGISMATFTFTRESDEVNTINTGNISLNFTEDTNGIHITDAYPMTDSAGKRLSDENQYFDFTVTTTITGKATAVYEVSAEKLANCTLNDNEVKLYLEKKTANGYEEIMAPKIFTPLTENSEVGTPVGNMVLTKESVSETTTNNYRLRMWVAEDTTINDVRRSFAVQVAVNATIQT